MSQALSEEGTASSSAEAAASLRRVSSARRAASTEALTLLWVACGTGDDLIEPNRDFVAWAKSKGLPVTAVETQGEHTWIVWRDNLLHFAPLLFRAK